MAPSLLPLLFARSSSSSSSSSSVSLPLSRFHLYISIISCSTESNEGAGQDENAFFAHLLLSASHYIIFSSPAKRLVIYRFIKCLILSCFCSPSCHFVSVLLKLGLFKYSFIVFLPFSHHSTSLQKRFLEEKWENESIKTKSEKKFVKLKKYCLENSPVY